MLAYLQTIPTDEAQWSRWSFSNYDCLAQIRQAIASQYGVNLPEYQVNPINWDNIEGWLAANYTAHKDFTRVLGQQSNDLTQVGFDKPDQVQSWVWLNYMELLNACEKLRIGP